MWGGAGDSNVKYAMLDFLLTSHPYHLVLRHAWKKVCISLSHRVQLIEMLFRGTLAGGRCKNHLCTHFSKEGKVLPGRNHPKTFDKKLFGKLIKVKERVLEIEASLKEKLEKTSNNHPQFLTLNIILIGRLGDHVNLHKFKCIPSGIRSMTRKST